MRAILLILINTIMLMQVASAQVVVDWDIMKLEDKFRGEIETGIKEYLGSDKKIKVYVQLNGRKKTEENKAVKFKDDEFGYLSVADSYQDVKVSEKVIVNSVTADIFVYEKVDSAVAMNIRKIAAGAMKGYKNATNLNVMPSPPSKAEEKKIEENKPSEEIKEPPFNLKKFLIDHASDIFKMFSTLFVGALGLLGVYLLARALIAAFKTIGDAMKASTEKIANQQQLNKEFEQEMKKQDEEKASHQKNEEFFNNHLAGQYERNIDIVKSCLRTSPHVFKQVMGRSEVNLNGLKSLLPLVTEYTVKLKETISPDLWKKLETTKGIDDGMFSRWLNTFAEDISVAQMAENGYFSYVVDHSLLEKVYSSKFSHLVDASLKVNSGILYKFILDFLPPEESTSLMKHFDEKTWKNILTERYVSVADLDENIKKMINIVDEIVEKEKCEINDQGLARILSNPMTFFLKNKSYEESEELFDILSTSAPELAQILKGKFWTPRMFLRIPDEYLNETFNILSVDHRVAILLGVSEDIRSHLLSFIPEGKVMTIVKDQYERDVANFDNRQKDKSVKIIKEYLEILKADSLADKFVLKEESEVAESVEVVSKDLEVEELESVVMSESDETEDLPEDISEATLVDVSEDTLEATSVDVLEDTLEATSADVSEDTVEATSADTSEDTLETTPVDTSKDEAA